MIKKATPEKVRKLIKDVSAVGKSKAFKNGDDLYEKMILDSYHVVQLIVACEAHFEIVFDYDDLKSANFRTVEQITSMLNNKIKSTYGN